MRTITSGNSHVEFDLAGGRLKDVTLDGIKIWGTYIRGDGKEANTHLCTPNFGPDTGSFGLPQHGPARNTQWEELNKDADDFAARCDIKGGTYPPGLIVTQKMKLGDRSFALTVIHSNKGEQKLPVNDAVHCYWDAPEGYKNITVNNEAVGNIFEENRAVPWKEVNEILIPGKPQITLKQTGFPYVMYWVYDKNTSTWAAMEPTRNDPASDFFGSPASMISPGESKVSSIEISI
jgi:galactose mutarotase-like enzyme